MHIPLTVEVGGDLVTPVIGSGFSPCLAGYRFRVLLWLAESWVFHLKRLVDQAVGTAIHTIRALGS
jgi:hypothetical protein